MLRCNTSCSEEKREECIFTKIDWHRLFRYYDLALFVWWGIGAFFKRSEASNMMIGDCSRRAKTSSAALIRDRTSAALRPFLFQSFATTPCLICRRRNDWTMAAAPDSTFQNFSACVKMKALQLVFWIQFSVIISIYSTERRNQKWQVFCNIKFNIGLKTAKLTPSKSWLVSKVNQAQSGARGNFVFLQLLIWSIVRF